MAIWILGGAVFGIVARLVLPGRDPNSIAVPLLLGAMGAVIGGVAGHGAGGAVLGALIFVVLYGVTTGRGPTLLHR